MKRYFTYSMLIASVLLGAGACKHEPNALAHHHHEGEEHADHAHGEEHDEHSEHGEHHGEPAHAADVIILEPEVAARFGVATDTAAVRPFARVVKVSGVLTAASEGSAVVSAPTAGIVTIARGISQGSRVGAGAAVASVRADAVSGGDANRAAKADLDAAETEYRRVDALYADRLVTLAQYNAAKAALERARAAYSGKAASGRVTSPISGVITSLAVSTGQYVETGATIATVAASDRLVLRADVPFNEYRSVQSATGARISVPYQEGVIDIANLDGRRLDAGNAAAGAAAGYVPVTFSLRNDGSLLPGSAVEVYLTDGSPRAVLTVPASAIVEQQGTYFVFERLDEDCYRKLPVHLGDSDGSLVEIRSGLKGGESIVSSGVTAVKLAQASGAVPAGHSHSH